MAQMDITREAAEVRPPIESGFHCRATVTSSERWAIPSAWRGHYVTFQAEGVAVFLLFGGASVAASASAVSTLSTEVLTAVATASLLIPANGERHIYVPTTGEAAAITHLAHIAAATTGFLRAYRSSGAYAGA